MSVSTKLRTLAVVGNPNAGKTTLFNTITGAHQKVANYPGVTVERVSGEIRLPGGETLEVVDVPGLYSLAAVSEDERVAVETVEGRGGFEAPDLLLCVLDASNLERNLFLFSQIAELATPTLVVLTMMDRAARMGLPLTAERLEAILGVPVVATSGKASDRHAILEGIERALATPRAPRADLGWPVVVESHVTSVRERLARMGQDFSPMAVRRAILHPDEPLSWGRSDLPEIREMFEAAREEVMRDPPEPGLESRARYVWAARIVKELGAHDRARPKTRTDAIDKILTHRVFGLVIFAAIMAGVFYSIYTLATPLMDAIDAAFAKGSDWLSRKMPDVPILKDLLIDGVFAGVGGMLVFLPQILILFFFISVLEGTGYLARAAFLMDRLLGWCGLNGRAFIPLLSSYACAIPGIMAARVMPDERSRLGTILVAPLMSCSARLPVYIVLIGAFIEPRFGTTGAALALFGMHLVGLLVAIPVAWFFNRRLLKGKRLPFLLELPPYQWPNWRDVGRTLLSRAQIFVKTAGTIIVVMSVLIWAALNFPKLSPSEVARIEAHWPKDQVSVHLSEAQMRESALGRVGRAIEPVFVPAGFDWRLTTAILAAFPAREVVVPSLGILFGQEDADEASTDLRKSLRTAKWPDGRPLITPWTAVGFMVFFALCAQCSSTLAAARRETGSWKWPLVMFGYMTALAYLGAVLVNLLGKAFGN